MNNSLYILLILNIWAYGMSAQNSVQNGASISTHNTIDLMAGSFLPTYSTDRTSSHGWYGVINNGAYINADDVIHIDGYMRYATLSSGFVGGTLPVGSGSDLRSVRIGDGVTSLPSSIEVGTAWIVGNPSTTGDPTSNGETHSTKSLGPGLMSVSYIGQWDWEDLGATNASGIEVTVSIPDLSGTGVSASDLRLVGWDGSQWVLLGTTGATGTSEDHLLTGVMISGIHALGIGSINILLPVELLTFDAVRNDESVKLLWSTSTEVNSSHFEVLHSDDLESWETITSKKAQGLSSSLTSYRHIHQDPSHGSNYYRLKQVDNDGSFYYSQIRHIIYRNEIEYTLYPNPADNRIFISGIKEGYNLVITNMLGQEQNRVTYTSDGIDISNLPADTYLIQSATINAERSMDPIKFIKI